MTRWLFPLCAGALFAALPLSTQMGPATGALLLLALSSATAMAASGGRNAVAAGAGAVGAFASTVLFSSSAIAAGAVLAASLFAERTMRIRERPNRMIHLGGAVLTGALAGTLSFSFASGTLAVRGVSAVVAAVLVSLPLLIDADDPLAHLLDGAGRCIDGPAGATLKEAAELRRTKVDEALDRSTQKRMVRTWKALEKLAVARVRLEQTKRPRTPSARQRADAIVAMVDGRITEHVEVLTRAHTAANTAQAAEAFIDDGPLKDAESVGDTFEEVSRAIVEDV